MSGRGRSERTAVAALAVSAALLLVGITWQLAERPGTISGALAVGALYALVPGLAGLLAHMRGRDDRRNLGAWRLLAISLWIIAVAFSSGSFAFYGGLDPSWVTISSVGTIVGYPLAFTGLARLASDRDDFGGNRIWIDALVMGLGTYSVGIAGFSIWLETRSAPPRGDALAAQAVFIALDLFILALCLSVASRFSWRLPTSWWLVMGAFAVFTAGDLGLLFLAATSDERYPASMYEVPLAFLLLGLAAYADRGMPRPRGLRREMRYTVPAIAVLASLAVLLWHPQGPLSTAALLAATVAVSAAVARLAIGSRDNRRLAEEYRTARTDDLTGLPNRRALLDHTSRSRSRLAVIVLDIDHFRDVNTTFGLAGGDQLLLLVTERLAGAVRHPDVLARLSADTFAVLLTDVDETGATTAAERLLRLLEAPFELNGATVHLTASAGVATSADPDPDLDMAGLLRDADFVMHRAKEDGPGLARLSSGGIGSQSTQRLLRRSQLRGHLNGGGTEFLAHYQPVVRLADDTVTSVEALVRWRDGDRVCSPAEFLPDIEAGGMLPELTRLMLHRALAEMTVHPGMRVAVNVPPDLVGPWLQEAIGALSTTAADPGRRLTVEITEDAIMRNPAAARTTLAVIRQAGVRVLLDDFGTGWSGLSTLMDLNIDGIKVDRSFVARATGDPSARTILEGVSSLARSLGLDVIAEGAEEPQTVHLLRDIGIDFVQGYVFARPMALPDLTQWMAAHAARD